MDRTNLNGLQGLAFLARCGVRVEMLDLHLFRVYGFYKSDSVDVNLNAETVTSRYDRVDTFEVWNSLVEQLVDLNEYWWSRSYYRYEGWAELTREWKKVREELEKLKV